MNILYIFTLINIGLYLAIFNLFVVSPQQVADATYLILNQYKNVILQQKNKIRYLEEYKREITNTFNILSIEFDIIKKHLDLGV
jgi:hypothetical protein